MSGIFEKYDVTDGDRGTLKRRAYALCSFLLSVDKAKGMAEKIGDNLADLDDGNALAGKVSALVELLLKTTDDTDSNPEWANLYRVLFDSSPFSYESRYIPREGEMAKLTRLCLTRKARVIVDSSEGMIF